MIKKAFVPIIAMLTAAVAAETCAQTVLDDVTTLVTAKTGAGGGKATAFHRVDGVVVAIKCYYHKVWMDPRVVDFGLKATSPTGLNNMCKDGVSKWTKQQRESKVAEAKLLDDVIAGDLLPADIEEAKAEIALNSSRIEPREDGYGFAELEDCIADSDARTAAE